MPIHYMMIDGERFEFPFGLGMREFFYMDDENASFLYRMFGSDDKIKPIYEWTPSIKEIEDPWYTGRFNVVVSQLKQCIEDILNNIKS